MNNIYVSINCLKRHKYTRISDIIKAYINEGITKIELGSTNILEEDIISKIFKIKEKHDVDFIIHNYFPPDEKGLIINLSSEDRDIRRESIEFIKKSIDLSKNLGSDLYTFHAGFRKDPGHGFDYKGNKLLSHQKAYENFKESIEEILNFTVKKNIKIAIENHQASEKVKDFVIFYDCEDFIKLLDYFKSPYLGLHLDVGHLKVASKTFSFDKTEFIKRLKYNIFSLHLHDNNGFEDTHEKFDENSWFLPYLNYIELNPYMILETNNCSLKEIKEMLDILDRTRKGEETDD